jgi:hypothetical protein
VKAKLKRRYEQDKKDVQRVRLLIPRGGSSLGIGMQLVILRLLSKINAHIRQESAELYKIGGFHPVQFNDLFNNQYRVFRKLGWATQSTVWLAEDEL